MIYEIGILSALLTVFLNYCIGKPGSDFSPYEIFSFYTVWLSKNRLKNLNLYWEYEKEYEENMKRTRTHSERLSIIKDFKIIIYSAAEPFFTWERAVGMCSVCTGVWISLLTGIYFTQNIVYLVSIVIISHITIRILNKFL